MSGGYLFAWFSASAASTTLTPGTSNALIVGDYSEVGGIEFDVDITSPANSTSTIDLSNDWGNTYQIPKADAEPVLKTNNVSETYLEVTFDVKIKDVSSSQSFATKLASLVGKNVNLTVSGKIRNVGDTADDANATTALKYHNTQPTRETDETQDKTWDNESLSFTNYTISGSETADSTIISSYSFYVGIDGTNTYAVDAIKNRKIVITVTPTVA